MGILASIRTKTGVMPVLIDLFFKTLAKTFFGFEDQWRMEGQQLQTSLMLSMSRADLFYQGCHSFVKPGSHL